MHDVQTCIRLVVPLTTARTRWMLGFQRRFERTCEWLMLTPNDGFLPHTSHTAAMTRFSNSGPGGLVRLPGSAECSPLRGARAIHVARSPCFRFDGCARRNGHCAYWSPRLRLGS